MTETDSFLARVREWQQAAIGIAPPRFVRFADERHPARGGLTGPAFFPEGLGLEKVEIDRMPQIFVIGHNFGSGEYRTSLEKKGREDDKATWRGLRRLLGRAGIPMAECFFTNWFIGLMPGNQQTGKFLLEPSVPYEEACRNLLLDEIAWIRPKLILLLGKEVTQLAHGIMPALDPWKSCKTWAEIDERLAPVQREVLVPKAKGHAAKVIALLHPSFGAANRQRRRSVDYPQNDPEVAMLVDGWKA